MIEISSSPEDRAQVWQLIKDIGIALLVSHGAGGELHGRPLASGQNSFDGKLWFMTQEGSAKLDELAQDPRVLVAYCAPQTQSYVAVSGKAAIVVDKEKTREIFDANARLWFPHGPDETDIRLICVEIESAEFWDRPRSSFYYAWLYLKTRLTGQRPGPIGTNKLVYF